MLFDKILENGFKCLPGYCDHSLFDSEMLKQALSEVHRRGSVFSVTDVANYIWSKECSQYPISDGYLPGKLPYDACFFEFTVYEDNFMSRYGLLAVSESMLSRPLITNPPPAVKVAGGVDWAEIVYFIGFGVLSDSMSNVVGIPEKQAIVVGVATVAVDWDGDIIEMDPDPVAGVQIKDRWLEHYEQHKTHAGVSVFKGGFKFGDGSKLADTFTHCHMVPFWCTLKFLKCKNVGTDRRTHSQKIQKRRTRRGFKPLVSSYTLNIEVPAAKTRIPLGKALAPRADAKLHHRRGHFKTYTPDAPLFGRLTGTYWWDPSLRGSADKGVVKKTYKLKTERG